MSTVEAASWDITLGAASTGLGQLILETFSDSWEGAPEAIDHVGLKVFGNLYEYGDLGILKTELEEGAELKSKYPAYSLRSLEPLGETEKTQEEFERWVEEQNNGPFSGKSYDLVSTSCVVWGIRGAQYLGVPHPENWDKIASWAARNKKFTSVVGKSGVAARQIQHKATEYVQNPQKIREKVKGLYKRLRRKKRAAAVENGEEDISKDAEEEDSDGTDGSEEDADGDNEEEGENHLDNTQDVETV